MKSKSSLLISFLFLFFAHNLLAENNRTKSSSVRALYLSDSTLVDWKKVQHYIQLTKHSAINAYVIDLKDIDGLVQYESKIPAVREAKAWKVVYDFKKIITAFHRHHIRVIGRIVCFNDPHLSAQKTDWALKDSSGKMYGAATDDIWLNPVNKNNWKYLVDIAKESLTLGVDEIQFDYVRFPSDGNTGSLDFGEKIAERYKVIDEFLAYAREEMPKAVLSADVFGIICESVNDPENIGQNLEYVGKNLDYISPMIYPSLFAKGQIVNGIAFDKPDLNPYGIVLNTLLHAHKRIAQEKDYRAKIRPYLQAYTASWLGKGDFQTYGADQIKQQIKAAEEAGCDGWIFWNEENKYAEDGFIKGK